MPLLWWCITPSQLPNCALKGVDFIHVNNTLTELDKSYYFVGDLELLKESKHILQVLKCQYHLSLLQ